MTRKLATLLAFVLALAYARGRVGGGAPRFDHLTEVVGPVVEMLGAPRADARYLDSKEYVLLYFSASWCGACQEFTPQLTRFHSRYAKNHDFEVVLVTRDHDLDSMRRELREHHMPWAAVRFDNGVARSRLGGWYGGGGGIPNLVLIDRQGRRLASTYGAFGYESPYQPLQELQRRWKSRDPAFTPAT